ncbi:MAG: hypothetical protein AB2556_19665, partial [Candidatus Thiodiazotropha sp.]
TYPIMKEINNCAWLNVGELGTCGKSCIVTYCKVHLHKIRKDKKIPTPCQKCGKGVQSEIKICRACGRDKIRYRHILGEENPETVRSDIGSASCDPNSHLEISMQLAYPSATMDDLIDEILAEMPDPAPGQFTDLDDKVPHLVRLPADQWVEILNDAKEFEVDGAAAVFSSWKVEEEDPLDIVNIEVVDSIHARAGGLALDARMTDERAASLLDNLPEGGFLLKQVFR